MNDLLKILITFVVTSGIWAWYLFHNTKVYEANESKYQRQIDSVSIQYNLSKEKINSLVLKYDSVASQKNKIEIKYKNKYEKVNTYNADSILSEFKRIFSANNIH